MGQFGHVTGQTAPGSSPSAWLLRSNCTKLAKAAGRNCGHRLTPCTDVVGKVSGRDMNSQPLMA
jgi:hypothetical protein